LPARAAGACRHGAAVARAARARRARPPRDHRACLAHLSVAAESLAHPAGARVAGTPRAPWSGRGHAAHRHIDYRRGPRAHRCACAALRADLSCDRGALRRRALAPALPAARGARSSAIAAARGPRGSRTMSLYHLQKLHYQLNRDPAVRKQYEQNFEELLTGYELTAEELRAIREPDIGLLYVMGVNGQILMHYAALR